MSVSAVEATPGLLGAYAASTSAASAAASEDKDLFLQLMVAQMKYQDPSKPTDSAQFLAQTAQFTALEKMQEVADQTAQLTAVQMAFGATGMVGRTVAYPSADGSLKSGVVSGVRFDATGPMLQVNGEDVPVAAVQALGDGSTDITKGLPSPADSDGTTTV